MVHVPADLAADPGERASKHGPLSILPGAARTGPGRRRLDRCEAWHCALGLRVADAVARSLPRGAAYALADLGGRAWYRLAAERRTLVAENMSAAGGRHRRPTTDRAIRRMVQRAFVNHARYWLEMLRSPYYGAEDIPDIVHVDDWERWEPVLRGGAVIALPHLGNFEPYGHFIVRTAARVAPVEETDPPELFDFLRARRASGKSGGGAAVTLLAADAVALRRDTGGAHRRP